MAARLTLPRLCAQLIRHAPSPITPQPTRTIASAARLIPEPRERRHTRDQAARSRKDAQPPSRRDHVRPSQLRKRPSPSRRRPRPTPPREAVLPDLGLTSEQLGALAAVSERKIFKCAKELDDAVHDASSVLSPALVELATEELRLNVVFRPQTEPLLSRAEQQQIVRDAKERRMPVVTVMGHVDHGKTSLLDAMRNSDVAKHELGGITQSVAAFQVPIGSKEDSSRGDTSYATFIDTPGHAAFKAMRANGTVGTDIVVLVVAADDGVMPQSVEAAGLAQSANVPIIVAVNKCDMPGADPERVRYQLLEKLNLNTEQLGGDVQCVDISAKTGSNLSQLLEAISLQAEMLDLRTNSEAPATGVCLESRVDKALGSIATVVVRLGTLRKGDHLVFQSPRSLRGNLYGRVRGLMGSDSKQVDQAGPGVAVGVVGIRETIPPGAEVRVMPSEKAARAKSQEMIARNEAALSTIEVANSLRSELLAQRLADEKKRIEAAGGDPSLANANVEEPSQDTSEPEAKPHTLVVLIKADVKGSADAVAQCIQALGSAQVPVRILNAGVGEINDMDVQIAAATNKVKGNNDVAMIVGFNVRVKDSVAKVARKVGLPIVTHSLIYHLEDELKERLAQIWAEQQTTEEVLGKASVVRVFENGAIAGCSVDDGAVSVGDMAKVKRFPEHSDVRERVEVFSGTIESIKQFAKTVRSVKKGSECGVSLKDWSAFAAGDQIECVSTSGPENK